MTRAEWGLVLLVLTVCALWFVFHQADVGPPGLR